MSRLPIFPALFWAAIALTLLLMIVAATDGAPIPKPKSQVPVRPTVSGLYAMKWHSATYYVILDPDGRYLCVTDMKEPAGRMPARTGPLPK